MFTRSVKVLVISCFRTHLIVDCSIIIQKGEATLRPIGQPGLEALLALNGAESGAIFRISRRERPRLVASSAVAQDVLDNVDERWTTGLIWKPMVFRGGGRLLPVQVTPHEGLLLYLDRVDPADCPPRQRVLLLSRVYASLPGSQAVDGKSQERALLLELLQEAEWNYAAVARRLECSRVTLYRRLRCHGITRRQGAHLVTHQRSS